MLRQLIGKGQEYQVQFILCFLGYKNSIPHVEWGYLCNILSEMGILKQLVDSIKNLYDPKLSTIRKETNHSFGMFKISRELNRAVYYHKIY